MVNVTWTNVWFFGLQPVLHLVVAFVMLRRRWFRLYPFFFAFVCLSVVRISVLLPLAFSFTKTHSLPLYRFYFWFFWCTEEIQALLVLFILYRIFDYVCAKYPILSRWTLVLYMLALAASLLLVIVYAPAAVRARGIFTILYPLWKSTLFLRAGMLVFLFLFAFLFGTRVRDFRFGIAAGFGVEALIILVEGVLNPRWKWISYVDTGASLIAGTIWFLYLVVPRTSTRFSGDLTGADSVARWKGALSEFLQK